MEEKLTKIMQDIKKNEFERRDVTPNFSKSHIKKAMIHTKDESCQTLDDRINSTVKRCQNSNAFYTIKLNTLSKIQQELIEPKNHSNRDRRCDQPFSSHSHQIHAPSEQLLAGADKIFLEQISTVVKETLREFGKTEKEPLRGETMAQTQVWDRKSLAHLALDHQKILARLAVLEMGSGVKKRTNRISDSENTPTLTRVPRSPEQDNYRVSAQQNVAEIRTHLGTMLNRLKNENNFASNVNKKNKMRESQKRTLVHANVQTFRDSVAQTSDIETNSPPFLARETKETQTQTCAQTKTLKEGFAPLRYHNNCFNFSAGLRPNKKPLYASTIKEYSSGTGTLTSMDDPDLYEGENEIGNDIRLAEKFNRRESKFQAQVDDTSNTSKYLSSPDAKQFRIRSRSLLHLTSNDENKHGTPFPSDSSMSLGEIVLPGVMLENDYTPTFQRARQSLPQANLEISYSSISSNDS